MRWQSFAVALLLLVAANAKAGDEIALEEHLGHSWAEDAVHERIGPFEAGQYFPGKLAIFSGGTALPAQIDAADLHPDGSIKSADIWWRTDLAAKAKKRFILRAVQALPAEANATGLQVKESGATLEIANQLIAVRLPAGVWNPSADASTPDAVAAALNKNLGESATTGGVIHGPILGVKLPSGKWTASAIIKPAKLLKGCRAEIIARGPVFARVKLTYTYADNGFHNIVVTVREKEPLVRIDESYRNGGRISFDLSAGYSPTNLSTKNVLYREIVVDKALPQANGAPFLTFTGHDFCVPDKTHFLALHAGKGDMLGMVSTDADWFPLPYEQSFSLKVASGGQVVAEARMASGANETARALSGDGAAAAGANAAQGQRHWGIYASTVESLLSGYGPKPEEEKLKEEVDKTKVAPGLPALEKKKFPPVAWAFNRWWGKQVAVPLDKVAHWKLVWPGMEDTVFPHTFFNAQELEVIRQRLRNSQQISKWMEGFLATTAKELWSQRNGEAQNAPADVKQAYSTYAAKFSPTGLPGNVSYLGAVALYTGDKLFLEQLKEADPLGENGGNAFGYLDFIINQVLEEGGYYQTGLYPMYLSDGMMERYIGMELLLGSDIISKAEKRDYLAKLAFLSYMLHDWMHLPPNYPFNPVGGKPYEGYVQGTPNMKHCYWSNAAIVACMLAGHPEQRKWIAFGLEENGRNLPFQIAASGALLESPFYSARDTLRSGPFWIAMKRAGAVDKDGQFERERRAFRYLADMLTPREPRMGGRRVYHALGRSSCGVIDPTFMIAAYPFGLEDENFRRTMRWCWEEQGRPNPDCMGNTGGRDLSQTLIAFSYISEEKPLDACPLQSRRYEGMGAVLRSNAGGDFESNIIFRHDPFCWDLYPPNNGALYFYGKGAPIMPRFGGYWMQEKQMGMMESPYGNRMQFLKGDNNCLGKTLDCAFLANQADYLSGETLDKAWRRDLIFAKDLDRDDSEYLLVRDEVARADAPTALHWWIMSKEAQPGGIKTQGFAPLKTNANDWLANLGHNWEKLAKILNDGKGADKARPDAALGKDDEAEKLEQDGEEKGEISLPKLEGQRLKFSSHFGVDTDIFIATPQTPKIVTDVAGFGPAITYCVDAKLYEVQQLIRIEQDACKPYLTLIAPHWAKAAAATYQTIAEGKGVLVKWEGREDRLFLGAKQFSFKDDVVDLSARAGYARKGGAVPLRLMVVEGKVSAGGITLSSTKPAALIYDGKAIMVDCGVDVGDVKVELAPELKDMKVEIRISSDMKAQ